MKNNTKKTYIVIAIVVIAVLLFIFWPSVSAMFLKSQVSSNPSSGSSNQPTTQNPVACTEEAKLCSDGTSVVRSGPKCEFAACPNIKQGKVAGIKQRILNGDVYITPLIVILDSRCPKNVLCVSAGTVILNAKLEKLGETKTVDFTLGAPVFFAGKKIMLDAVIPARSSVKPIPNLDYRFTFSVSSATGVTPQ